jgi:hypothetical protein
VRSDQREPAQEIVQAVETRERRKEQHEDVAARADEVVDEQRPRRAALRIERVGAVEELLRVWNAVLIEIARVAERRREPRGMELEPDHGAAPYGLDDVVAEGVQDRTVDGSARLKRLARAREAIQFRGRERADLSWLQTVRSVGVRVAHAAVHLAAGVFLRKRLKLGIRVGAARHCQCDQDDQQQHGPHHWPPLNAT